MTTAAVNALQVSSLLCKNTREEEKTQRERRHRHTQHTPTHTVPHPPTPPTAEEREGVEEEEETSRSAQKMLLTFGSPQLSPPVKIGGVRFRGGGRKGRGGGGRRWAPLSPLCVAKRKRRWKRGGAEEGRGVEGSEEEREKMSLEEA